MKFVGKVVKVLLEFLIGCAIFLVVTTVFIFFGTWLFHNRARRARNEV